MTAAAPAIIPAAEAPPQGGQDAAPTFTARADALIGGMSYDSAATAHYKVKTDDPRLLPAKAAALLEEFRAFFDRYWAGRVELLPHDTVSPVYLFYSRFHYKRLLGVPPDSESQPSLSEYVEDADAIVVHSDGVAQAQLPDVILRDAARQLVRRRIFGGGSPPPPWVEEGLAAYFGHMGRDEKGVYEPGRIDEKHCWIFRDSRQLSESLARSRARAFARILRGGKAEPLGEMLAIRDREAFLADRRPERQGASWMLVHFLLHGDDGAHAAGFLRCLAREIREDLTVEDFHREIGIPPDQLQMAFEKHARKHG